MAPFPLFETRAQRTSAAGLSGGEFLDCLAPAAGLGASEESADESTAPWAEVCNRLNATLRGWQNYFRQRSVSRAYTIVNRYVEQRVRSFLRRRHLSSGVRGTRRFSTETIYGVLGVHRCAR